MVLHITFKTRPDTDIVTSRVTVTERATLVVGTLGSHEFNEWNLSEIEHAWVEEE